MNRVGLAAQGAPRPVAPIWRLVVVAGGGGYRLGGVYKPGIAIDGVSLLNRTVREAAQALENASGAPVPVVVLAGGHGLLTNEALGCGPSIGSDITVVADAGLGPAGAVSRWCATSPGSELAAVVLAADWFGPLGPTVGALVAALQPGQRREAGTHGAEGAYLVDAEGREQWLAAAWKLETLRSWAAGAPRSFRALASRPAVQIAQPSGLRNVNRVVDLLRAAGESLVKEALPIRLARPGSAPHPKEIHVPVIGAAADTMTP